MVVAAVGALLVGMIGVLTLFFGSEIEGIWGIIAFVLLTSTALAGLIVTVTYLALAGALWWRQGLAYRCALLDAEEAEEPPPSMSSSEQTLAWTGGALVVAAGIALTVMLTPEPPPRPSATMHASQANQDEFMQAHEASFQAMAAAVENDSELSANGHPDAQVLQEVMRQHLGALLEEAGHESVVSAGDSMPRSSGAINWNSPMFI